MRKALTPAKWTAKLEQALFAKRRAVTARSLKTLLDSAAEHLQTACDDAVAQFVSATISLCKRLHAEGRDSDALPLARLCCSLAARVDQQHYPHLHWQSLNATGILLAHSGDYSAAIAEHSHALHLAEASGQVADQVFSWNNLGNAFKHASVYTYSLALECYTRAYEHHSLGPVFSRYSALINIAHCQLYLGHLRKGRAAARLALRYETAAFRSQNPYNAAILRDNLARLLLAAGKKEQALAFAEQVYQLATAAPSLLMSNLVNVLRATLDVAYGRVDLGITRLESELQRVRHLPEPRADTLSALVEAEQAAGHFTCACAYWQQLPSYLKPGTVAGSGAAISAAGTPITLEPDEHQLLQWLAEGHSSKMMARLRPGSDKSIRTYLSRIYTKIGVSNGKAAVAWLLNQPPAANESVLSLPAIASPSAAADASTRVLCSWYVRCLAKGYWDTAISHWQMTAEAERPAAARYPVALMLLLQSRVSEALAEAKLLKGITLHALQCAEQWLSTQHEESLRNLQELAQSLAVGNPDRYATLLALYHGTLRMNANDPQTVVDNIQALYEEVQALDGYHGHCDRAD